jgi:retron-type reverse transcriptase
MFLFLQKRILNSCFARLIAVANVLSNKGGFTPGVDGKRTLNNKGLGDFLFGEESYLHKMDYSIRQVLIPKGTSGETRPLGIPNMEAKFAQELVRLILEPLIEFEDSIPEHKNSFGFKKAHGCLNAIHSLMRRIGKPLPTFVINLDLAKCFDSILHSAIIEKLEFLKFYPTTLVTKMLDFKTVVKVKNEKTKYVLNYGVGTPQGSVLSPMLCNVVLNNIKTNST